MAFTWTDPTGAAATIYSVDGNAGIMTLDNVDNEGTQLLLDLEVEECEVTFTMDWVTGGAGTLTPAVYYRAAPDLSIFYKVEFQVILDSLTSDEIVGIVLSSEIGVIGSAAVSKVHTVGVPFRVKVRSTINHFVKVWAANVAEPDDWDLVAGGGSVTIGTVGLSGAVALDAPVPASLTPFYMLGFESGNISRFNIPIGNTRQLFSDLTGNAALSSAGQGRDGVGYALVCSPAASQGHISKATFPVTVTELTAVLYFRFDTSLPVSGRAGIIEFIMGGAGNRPYVQYQASSGRLVLIANSNAGATTGLVTGPIISANTWYRLELKQTNPSGQLWEWSVDGVPQTSTTFATPSTSLSTIALGHNSLDAGSVTASFRIDDCLFTASSADYPIGAVSIKPLIPDPAGPIVESGTANALARFTADGGGLDVTFSSPNIVAALSTNVTTPAGSIDGVYQRTSGATNFISVPMQNYALAAGEGVGAVRLELIGWKNAPDNTNNFQILANVGGADTTILNGDPGWSSGTNFGWACAVYTPSGGWDQTKLNSFNIKLGGSTDISPQPGINYCFAEVAIRSSDDAGAAVIDLEFDDFQVCACEVL